MLAPYSLLSTKRLYFLETALAIVKTANDEDYYILLRIWLIRVVVATFIVDGGGSKFGREIRTDAKELPRQIHLNHFLQLAFLIQERFIASLLLPHAKSANQQEALVNTTYVNRLKVFRDALGKILCVDQRKLLKRASLRLIFVRCKFLSVEKHKGCIR